MYRDQNETQYLAVGFWIISKGNLFLLFNFFYLQSWILKTSVPAYYGSMPCSVQFLHAKWSFKIQKDVLVLGTSAIHIEQNIQMLWFIKYWMALDWFFSLALWCKNEDKCCGMKMNMNSLWWTGCKLFSDCLCWCLCPLFKCDKTALCWCCFSYQKIPSSGQMSATLVWYSFITRFFVPHLSQEAYEPKCILNTEILDICVCF